MPYTTMEYTLDFNKYAERDCTWLEKSSYPSIWENWDVTLLCDHASVQYAILTPTWNQTKVTTKPAQCYCILPIFLFISRCVPIQCHPVGWSRLWQVSVPQLGRILWLGSGLSLHVVDPRCGNIQSLYHSRWLCFSTILFPFASRPRRNESNRGSRRASNTLRDANSLERDSSFLVILNVLFDPRNIIASICLINLTRRVSVTDIAHACVLNLTSIESDF